MVIGVVPSPQSTVTVCVSAVPGSSNPPVAVTDDPALRSVLDTEKDVIEGTTLLTVIVGNRLTENNPSLRVTCIDRFTPMFG